MAGRDSARRGLRHRPALRLLLAALAATVALGLASLGLLVTTAPELVSLLVEPFSLLLLPGNIVAMVLGGMQKEDPSTPLMMAVNFILYLVCAYLLMGLRRRSPQGSGYVVRQPR